VSLGNTQKKCWSNTTALLFKGYMFRYRYRLASVKKTYTH